MNFLRVQQYKLYIVITRGAFCDIVKKKSCYNVKKIDKSSTAEMAKKFILSIFAIQSCGMCTLNSTKIKTGSIMHSDKYWRRLSSQVCSQFCEIF